MVSAQCHQAAQVGADVLSAGGTAVDAAIAASFVSGVLEPWMSGPLGGGAMLVAHPDNHPEAILFNPKSPEALDPAQYPLEPGHRASDLFPWAAVVDGRIPWAELVAPAVTEAKQGIPLDWYSSLVIATKACELAQDPHCAQMFLDQGQWPKTTTWTMTEPRMIPQPAAACSLERLAKAGPEDFYHGDLARQILQDAAEQGVPLSADDLSKYRPEVLPALSVPSTTGYLWATPGLTGGPTLIDTWQRYQAAGVRDIAATRAALLAATAQRRQTMGHNANPSIADCTTHISVVDRDGRLVSLTQTILSVFGACLLAPRSGFLFNNGIMWFDPKPGGPNTLAPGRTCLMNVCPVVGESTAGRFALGACGGRKILPAVFQIADFLLEGCTSLEGAFGAPRIDTPEAALTIVDPRLPMAAQESLAQNGSLRMIAPSAFPVTYGSAVAVMQTADGFEGCTEPHSPWADSVGPTSVNERSKVTYLV
ncbi:gamma-glutamyltransferase [Phaeobacter sp.]|uniref:gamma-glutamyltransferase n=1 Tax=Phaeobacter sp. TaxID=1902409 RepID=UPI0025DB42E9|nr:gamma-glutamyltransferase [Phaeobacter sp.]